MKTFLLYNYIFYRHYKVVNLLNSKFYNLVKLSEFHLIFNFIKLINNYIEYFFLMI